MRQAELESPPGPPWRWSRHALPREHRSRWSSRDARVPLPRYSHGHGAASRVRCVSCSICVVLVCRARVSCSRCVVLEVCRARGVSCSRCVVLEVCRARGVSCSRCVVLEVCRARGVSCSGVGGVRPASPHRGGRQLMSRATRTAHGDTIEARKAPWPTDSNPQRCFRARS